jgi:hypothetical protein
MNRRLRQICNTTTTTNNNNKFHSVVCGPSLEAGIRSGTFCVIEWLQWQSLEQWAVGCGLWAVGYLGSIGFLFPAQASKGAEARA